MLQLFETFFHELGLEVQDSDPYLTILYRTGHGIPQMRLFMHTESKIDTDGFLRACQNFEMGGFYVYGNFDYQKGMGLMHFAVWGPTMHYFKGTYTNEDILAFLCQGMGGNTARLPSAVANMEEAYEAEKVL